MLSVLKALAGGCEMLQPTMNSARTYRPAPSGLLPLGASADCVSAPAVDALQRRLDARGMHTQLIETHISRVLLAGAHAYKFKKPVRLPFLDYSTLSARRHFCEEELRLNRRLAPQLYIGVLPLRRGPSGPTFHGHGAVVDWALKMHRLPAGALASQQLAMGQLDRDALGPLAHRLARFHDSAASAPAGAAWGSASRVLGDARQVLQSLSGQAGADAAVCAALLSWFEQRCSGEAGKRFSARQAAGRVREGHGDLHLDNIVVLPDGVTAFDCIEFDPGLRWIDVMADIGYLVMDLQAHGRRDLAHAFLDAYLEASGDYDGLSVLRDYVVYRALVRALVGTLRESEHVAAAALPPQSYVMLAQRLVEPPTPRLLITHGLPGSGKTHLTRQLHERAAAIRIRSDVERARLAGAAPAWTGPRYGEVATRTTYTRVLALARTSLQAGYPTIIDAAFLQRWQRDAARALAQELRVPFTLLSCQAPMEVLRQRVQQRQTVAGDASQADEAVLEQLAGRQQPLDDDERPQSIEVATAEPLPMAGLVAQWLAAGR